MKITHGMMAALQNVRMKGVRVRFTEDYAEAMIAAVAPLILEEAAKAVEVLPGTMAASPTHVKATGPKECAAVIRALSPTSHTSPEE